MNDRFRYRVWDKTKNKWLHFDFSTYPTYQDRIWQALTDGETFYQCTGLKDKNGKLIYEGDVVKSDFDFITNTINPLRFNIGNVIYSDYIAGFVIASDINDYSPYKTSFFGKTEALNCMVIGNIYENKELLESEG